MTKIGLLSKNWAFVNSPDYQSVTFDIDDPTVISKNKVSDLFSEFYEMVKKKDYGQDIEFCYDFFITAFDYVYAIVKYNKTRGTYTTLTIDQIHEYSEFLFEEQRLSDLKSAFTHEFDDSYEELMTKIEEYTGDTSTYLICHATLDSSWDFSIFKKNSKFYKMWKKNSPDFKFDVNKRNYIYECKYDNFKEFVRWRTMIDRLRISIYLTTKITEYDQITNPNPMRKVRAFILERKNDMLSYKQISAEQLMLNAKEVNSINERDIYCGGEEDVICGFDVV